MLPRYNDHKPFQIDFNLPEDQWEPTFFDIADGLLELIRRLKSFARVSEESWQFALLGQKPGEIIKGDSAIIEATASLDESLEPVREAQESALNLIGTIDGFNEDAARCFDDVEPQPSVTAKFLGKPRVVTAFKACIRAEEVIWNLLCTWTSNFSESWPKRDSGAEPIVVDSQVVAQLELALKKLPNRWIGWPEASEKPSHSDSERLRFDDVSQTVWVDDQPTRTPDKFTYKAFRKIAESSRLVGSKELNLGSRADRYLRRHLHKSLMAGVYSQKGKKGGYQYLLPSTRNQLRQR